jgi:hypothetical protein
MSDTSSAVALVTIIKRRIPGKTLVLTYVGDVHIPSGARFMGHEADMHVDVAIDIYIYGERE